jgi:hypothetical protein
MMSVPYEHPSFPKPPAGSRLWRYMAWSRCQWLVTERRLLMSSLPSFDDKFEGKTPTRVAEALSKALAEAKTDGDRAIIAGNIEKLRHFAAAFYSHYFVSCWHLNDVESAAMWGAYTKTPESVAIRTTIEALRRELPWFVEIGQVRYIDYDAQGFASMNMFEWVMHKRRHYAEEREVRAVASALIPDEIGGREMREQMFELVDKPTAEFFAPLIEPTRLIEAIYLHPSATPEFAAEVAEFCKASGLPMPIPSALAAVGAF